MTIPDFWRNVLGRADDAARAAQREAGLLGAAHQSKVGQHYADVIAGFGLMPLLAMSGLWIQSAWGLAWPWATG